MFATKPRDPSSLKKPSYGGRGRQRLSPLMILGISVPVLIAVIGVIVFVNRPQTNSHAAALNTSCTVIVPANPLTAQGLATPYQLVATNPAMGPCNEANPGQSAFVQAVILDPNTGAMTAYEPLVIDQGTQPAIQPVVPQLPAGAVVGIWFGDNGNALTLAQNTVRRAGRQTRFNMTFTGGTNGNCVNGVNGTVFGQFSYCNAVNFFQTANKLIAAGKITVPALGTASDGKACPTTRDFSIVDMDQSDNVQTQYLANAQGQISQLSAANQAKLPGATTLGNPSDNALVTHFVDPALGCTPFSIPDQVNPGTMTPTLATDELEAAADQQAPVALVPGGDEMVLVNGQLNLQKINAYRAGVDQTPAATLNDASTTTYCQNLVNVALPRLQLDMATFSAQPSPDGGAATNSLFTFLANRLNGTLGAGGLNCVGLLNIQNPVTLTTDGNGIVTAATIATTPLPAGATATPAAGTTPAAGGVTGNATITLNAGIGNAQIMWDVATPSLINQRINIAVTTNSCTGTKVFSSNRNTGSAGQNTATSTINRLRGLTALPSNWFFVVSQNGAVLSCGSVAANGTTGTATLGTITPAAPAAAPTTAPVATPTTAAAPAATPTTAPVATPTTAAAAVTPTATP